jgi:hypothetical protein
MSIVQYVSSIRRCGIIIVYTRISDVFFVPYCYRSARLSYIGIAASVTFKLVYTAGVGVYTCTLVADILYWWLGKLSSGSFV